MSEANFEILIIQKPSLGHLRSRTKFGPILMIIGYIQTDRHSAKRTSRVYTIDIESSFNSKKRTEYFKKTVFSALTF